MAERIKKADVEKQIETASRLTGMGLFLYSAYGQYGVRVEGRHVMEGLGTLREVSVFMNGMLKALDIQRGEF